MDSSLLFLPWVRRGISGAIQAGTTRSKGRVQIAVYAALRDQGRSQDGPVDVPVKVSLFGPGDVLGFDPRMVIRTDPIPLANDCEPNYFPALEFDLPEFPWLFSPDTPDANGRLQPWICLVTVEKREGKLTVDPMKPLPVLHIEDAASELPNLDEAWAWAHAQISGGLEAGQTIVSVLKDHPERTLSRLLSPRRLNARTTYLACVVPTYFGGRQAGLGEMVDDSKALDPAWDGHANPLDLPVYFHWEFSTGVVGDFESLVWQLQRCETLPPLVGVGAMTIPAAGPSASWPNSDQLPLATLPLEGALKPARADEQPSDDPLAQVQADPDYQDFQEALRALLNGSAPEPDRPLGLPMPPPMYGRWHAAQTEIPNQTPPAGVRNSLWLRELNLNPTHRVAAALGTRIVQEQQEELMSSAWNQAGAIEMANQALRQAQMARAASLALFETRLKNLPTNTFLTVTAPVLGRVTADPNQLMTLTQPEPPAKKTLSFMVERSRVPSALLQGPFRRLTAPRGPLARRAARRRKLDARRIIEYINSGKIRIVPGRRNPGGMTTADTVFAQVGRMDKLCLQTGDDLFDRVRKGLPDPEQFRPNLEPVLDALEKLLSSRNMTGEARELIQYAYRLLKELLARVGKLSVWKTVEEIRLVLGAIAQIRSRLREAARLVAGGTQDVETLFNLLKQLDAFLAPQDLYPRLFASTAALVQAGLPACDPPGPPQLPALRLDEMKKALVKALDPGVTIPARMKARLDAPGWDVESLEPIMLAPEFPQPMYRALANLSQDFMLPGLEHVPPNIIAGLETNTRFIAAFMVGLNHEMGRELLWRGFPTDQRGSYFRQFWENRGRVPSPADGEGKDIAPLHTWPRSSHLEDNVTQGAGEGAFTLLIRGDLLRRYPRTSIYAAKAAWGKDANNQDIRSMVNDPQQEKHPIFKGTLPPDLSFFGFDFSPEQAQGSEAGPGITDAGYFIILQQPPAEPRFGLDETTPTGNEITNTWRDLSWPVIATSAVTAEGEQVGYVQLAPADATKIPARPTQEQPETNWAADSTAMAYITLQMPFRVAIHATDLIG